MKRHWLILTIALLCGMTALNARPVDVERAKTVGMKFACAKLQTPIENLDFQLVYTATTNRNEACFHVFNIGEQGFVIVSADDRFRPIVGYSLEGPFAVENRSPELDYYLGQIIAARTRPDAVVIDNVAEEWKSVMATGQLLSRNRGRGVDVLCETKWNQNSPYNLYAPAASGGPGNRCYAGCVATAMSQVMKYWDHPLQGTSSHSYYCYGYGQQSANFGSTTYDWEHMPARLAGNSTDEEIEAVALLMYHCAVAVDMMFSPNGSGAYSWDVPAAIRKYFSYSNQAVLRQRDSYTLVNWQNLLKDSFDKHWPVYYSGYSDSGGHAFVCDGYDDNDLFHYNWGWGGSSDGWFVIDEIDYAGGAGAIFNFVPTNVYLYMPMQPDNLEVFPSGDIDYAATINWTNPTHTILGNALETIDQIVVMRNDQIIYTEDNVTPGADMSFTDHYIPTSVRYSVYAVVQGAKGLEVVEENVVLGPSCQWTLETDAVGETGWNGAYLSMMDAAGVEIGQFTHTGGKAVRNVAMPVGHVALYWNSVTQQSVEQMSFSLKDADDNTVVAFEGTSSDLPKGLFFVVDNTCGAELNSNVPQNLSAQRDDTGVILQWEAESSDFNYFCVYRDHLMIALSENNQFVDNELDAGLHTYYVTTINDHGESVPSNMCNVQSDGDCNAPTNLRYEIANKKVKLTWDAPEGDAPTGYYVYRRTKGEAFKRIKPVGNTTYSDNINVHPNEVYEYAVAAYYQATDCTSAYASAQDQPELNLVTVNKTIIPLHLAASVDGNSVVLNWNVALMAETYNVYRNGELIAEGLTETAYIDEAVVSGENYTYTVTGKTSFLESNPSNEVMVEWGTTIIEGNENQGTSLYPNPTTGKVVLVKEDLVQVVVLNAMGQEVMRQSAQDGQVHLDLSALPDGTYFVKAIAENGSLTQKIVKIQ